jgi:hypothetical protein
MKTKLLGCLLAATGSLTFAQNFTVNFSWNQSDATTGSGTIAPFTLAGHDFTATTMPAPTVLSPGGAAPSGFVSRIIAQAGAANEANNAAGLLWSGFVTATATDGATVQIPLVFAPKQNQLDTTVPGGSDYHWSISYGDSPTDGVDTVGTGFRFAMLLNRDTTIDAVETPNTFQRYTQQTQNFVAGQDNLSNTDITTATIKDATDSGNPAGTDAAGRNLEFYWAWRDGGTLNAGGAILVNDFNVSGLLVPDQTTLVPEPGTTALGILGVASLFAFRRRK